MQPDTNQAYDLDAEVRRVTQSLLDRHGSDMPVEVVEQTVRQAFAEREGAKVKDFVSLLAERSAAQRLRSLRRNAP